MAKQLRQPNIGQHLSIFRENIAKSIPLSNSLAALLMTGIQEIFNHITDCPCSSGVMFGWLTIMGPIVILFGSLAYESCSFCCGHGEGKHFARRSALMFVASMSWVSVALLNSEALCCIQGGFPSNSPCLAGRNATENVVRYEKCISDSWNAGSWIVMVSGAISFIVVVIVQAKCGHLNSVKDPNIPLQSVGQSRIPGPSK